MSALPKEYYLERYGPRALILGGSEGIGAAFAHQLAEWGFDLTLVGRTQSKLDAIASAIRERHGVDVATQALDLTDPDIARLAGEVVAQDTYGLVVCNAGATHGVSFFLDQPLQKAIDLVTLNCTSTLAFAHHALAPMRDRGRGGFIVVSSMSAMAGAGYVATYAAAKSFEIILAEGLHWEMAKSGVDVMCAVASLTDTPAMARSGIILDADSSYVAMDSGVVAHGALTSLGQMPVWFAAGEEAAEAIRQAPRLALSDRMSQTSAKLWGIEA